MDKNPFHIKEIPVSGAFCDRKRELTELISYAESGTNVVLFSPRRYGKTSLTRRIQAKLAKAIYVITHTNESIFHKAIKFITSYRPVLESNMDGTISISVQPAFKKSGMDLLTETMDALEKFVTDIKIPIHIAFDEFQELVEVDKSPAVEGILRHYIQHMGCSFFFIGSRRRILLEIFNDRKRPFFQSAMNYELKPLPKQDIVSFIQTRFKSGKKHISKEYAIQIADLIAQHPYYMQKLCFLLYDRIKTNVTEQDIFSAYNQLLNDEKFAFENILQGLTSKQISLLDALAREPEAKIYSAHYINKYTLGSTGGVQKNIQVLSRLDLVEKDLHTKQWSIVDPVFRKWLIKLSN